MIGLLLIVIGTGSQEVRNILLKRAQNDYSVEQLGALSAGFGFLILAISALVGLHTGSFVPHLAEASIPLIIIRLALEILLAYITIKAIEVCDRSAFSIIRVLTIPLLVGVDILMGYTIGWLSILGVAIICCAFLIELFVSKDINWQGRKYALLSAVLAVVTTSMYKYLLTGYGNSVEIVQCIMTGGIFIFFVGRHFWMYGKHPFHNMSNRYLISMGSTVGLSVLLISYAYLYLIASIAITFKRSFALLYAVISGVVLFNEKHFRHKIVMILVIIGGISLMMVA